MVNATCDFCSNTYRKNPNVGYFKVSSALKSSLCIREGADLNTICGEHFSDADIADSGRLRPEAKPVFFPRLSTAAHDHPYVGSEDAQDDNAGMYYNYAVAPVTLYSEHVYQIKKQVRVEFRQSQAKVDNHIFGIMLPSSAQAPASAGQSLAYFHCSPNMWLKLQDMCLKLKDMWLSQKSSETLNLRSVVKCCRCLGRRIA